MTGQNENLIPFQKKEFSTVTLNMDMNDPELRAQISSADSLVSYSIDDMSIDELRTHARCSIVLMHNERLRHLEAIGKLKRQLSAQHPHGIPNANGPYQGTGMEKEINLTLNMGDLINIHDALANVAKDLEGDAFIDLSCTLDAITSVISDHADKEKSQDNLVSIVGGIDAAKSILEWSKNDSLNEKFWVDAAGDKKYILSRYIGYEYIDVNQLQIAVDRYAG